MVRRGADLATCTQWQPLTIQQEHRAVSNILSPAHHHAIEAPDLPRYLIVLVFVHFYMGAVKSKGTQAQHRLHDRKVRHPLDQ